MRDPVLERDMFRKTEATPPSEGVVSLVKEESDYERRKKQAAELLAVAKERQNPENYKTLSEQNRPGVFRPVATAQPQAPQPNTQQQMAQMQAMGFRPVGMADGGYVQHFADGSGPTGVVPFIPDPSVLGQSRTEPGISQSPLTFLEPQTEEDIAKIFRDDPEESVVTVTTDSGQYSIPRDQFLEYYTAKKNKRNKQIDEAVGSVTSRQRGSDVSVPRVNLPTEKPADVLTESASSGQILSTSFPGLAKATDEDIDRMAREELDRVNRARAKSPLGRGIQSLLTRDETDLDKIKAELRSRRDKVREATAIKETPIPSPFSLETASTADIEAQKVLREEALLRARGLPTEADREATRARMLGQARGVAAATGETPGEEPKPATEPKAEPKTTPDAKKGIGALPGLDKPTDMESIKAARNAARQENINLALIQAGLAMAGGQSSNALTNIATGGISGIQAFQEAEKARRLTDLEDRKMAIQEQYYKDRAEREQATIDRASDRNRIALMNLRRQALDSAAKEFETLVEADPTLKLDAKKRDLVMNQLTEKYMRGLMVDNALGTGLPGQAPALDESAPSILD